MGGVLTKMLEFLKKPGLNMLPKLYLSKLKAKPTSLRNCI